jgi:hypothetical protein
VNFSFHFVKLDGNAFNRIQKGDGMPSNTRRAFSHGFNGVSKVNVFGSRSNGSFSTKYLVLLFKAVSFTQTEHKFELH